MSDTHPNALRMEADEKRKQAVQLINEANEAEAKAAAAERELTGEPEPVAPGAPVEKTPPEEDKTSKNPFKSK
jgi:hypothetical protein